ncbi:hypothetical protein DL766_006560 [Monosporascus sp. MC13-8B]|uniref:Cupin type-1 domain-containing protein n=1 Tax=Monosporascus cannonballus TaxID=155416 RepID=A0ABY0HAH2_9PEZI|nr:hypothetical protein DL762_003465 [Monosporascus cannonballus]RYO94651.1 hypothetical protein DL763_004018 [Monosporascus cannonballus]RYP26963.1 hypothetical protein DL766_006560 [Monosporascus sp. MC13-8B]
MLGNGSNMSYTVIPPNYDGSLHNAPPHNAPLHNQQRWVVFISGLAYITLPDDDTTSAHISGGEFGLIFAADIAEVSRKGHRTQYPGITETIALVMPTVDGQVPAHSLLHMGPCSAEEVVGVRRVGA